MVAHTLVFLGRNDIPMPKQSMFFGRLFCFTINLVTFAMQVCMVTDVVFDFQAVQDFYTGGVGLMQCNTSISSSR